MTQPLSLPDSPPLVFLKLGGSLITDKNTAHTARPAALERLAGEIQRAQQQRPHMRLLLGHGSGSYGHVPARKYGTRAGVSGSEQWRGFVEVWQEAAALNHEVMASLQKAGLPAIAFPPSASVVADDGLVLRWDLAPLRAALHNGLLPVVYGDVIFDARRGGTILSTEDLFGYLARQLHPGRILLAGREPGVWADFPACTWIVPEITPGNIDLHSGHLAGSAAVDVTGGMRSKVQQALSWVQEQPGLEACIFSGEEPGEVERLLLGQAAGTILRAPR